MSRRCRKSLVGSGGTLTGGDLSSGCDCGRLTGGKPSAPCKYDFVPGFTSLDQHVALNGVGAGNELPKTATLTFDDGSIGTFPAYVLQNSEPGYDDSPAYIIEILDTDPPAGHIYHLFLDGGAFSGDSNRRVYLASGLACYPTAGVTQPYTSAARYGDLVVIRYQHKAQSLTGTPGTTLQIYLIDNDTTYTPGAYQFIRTCGTSYSSELISTFLTPNVTGAPDDIIAMRVLIEPKILTTDWYLGDMSVQVIPASATGIVLCAQANLITIDNSTTETAFL